MSLVWQKQLLLEDYRRVCGPEGKKGKYTDGVIRPHRVRGGETCRKWNRTCHMSVCKPVNLMTRTAGKSLLGIPKWHQYSSVITLLTFLLPSSTWLPRQREEANQSVNADGAKAAINKVSLLFTFWPENHL